VSRVDASFVDESASHTGGDVGGSVGVNAVIDVGVGADVGLCVGIGVISAKLMSSFSSSSNVIDYKALLSLIV